MTQSEKIVALQFIDYMKNSISERNRIKEESIEKLLRLSEIEKFNVDDWIRFISEMYDTRPMELAVELLEKKLM